MNTNFKPIPEIGKEYICYDDYKISPSRQYKVLILSVISFDKVADQDKEAFLNSKFTSREDGLFIKEPDYFIYAVSYEQRDRPMIEIFSRMKNGGWFGIGEPFYDHEIDAYDTNTYWCSGVLDIDGTLTEDMEKIYKELGLSK